MKSLNEGVTVVEPEPAIDPHFSKLIDNLQPEDEMNKHVIFINAGILHNIGP